MNRVWGVAGVCLGIVVGATGSAALSADQSKGGLGNSSEVVVLAQSGTSTTDTKFVEIEPVRAFDSRIPKYVARGMFAPNTSRVVAIRDGHDAAGNVTVADAVPVGATAVSYNLTVTGPTGPNFVSITPGDATAFTTSAINFNGTADVANAGIVSIDVNRTVRIWNGDQGGSTHVIIDITGYFVKPLFAEVHGSGALSDGSRAISATKIDTGKYGVRFDRDVSGCAYTATIGGATFAVAGVIDTGLSSTSNDTVEVFTQDNDGSPPAYVDKPFHLTITC